MGSLFDLPFEEPGAADSRTEGSGPRSSRTDPPAARRRVVTVTELTARLRRVVEEQFADIWVEGEISNCRRWNTGHVYFTLKDAGAQIRAVMFRSAARAVRFSLQDGLRVVARGRVGVYEPKGEYQIVCDRLEPAGFGALQLAFDQRKRRLGADGLFDPSRKRSLPELPRKIGVVTSLDGAAVRDILHVLRRRHPNAHVVIRPARVQGEGAASDVARAIAAIARVPGVDVVIVGRGGGSMEDLWAFNEEAVARALAACPIATISAVGHESDVTIADLVADVRAPTPSAAAEMVVARKDEVSARIDRLAHRAAAAARARLHRQHARLRALEARPGYAALPARVMLRGRHAAEMTHQMRRAARARITACERRYLALRRALDAVDLRRRLAAVRARLLAADGRAVAATVRTRHHAERRFAAAAARLDALSPLAVLARGYAVCWTEDRAAVLRDASAAAPGQRVRVTLHRGELTCEVRGTRTPTDHGSDDQGL